MTAMFSEHFQADLLAMEPQERNALVGEIVRLARAEGIQIKHRPKGWSTYVGDDVRHWWPKDVNAFVDYLADEIHKRVKS